MKRISTRNMILCALFAALTAVFSQIQLPIGPVPINLATMSVFLAGGILGWKYGAVSQLVYVLLGVIGAPVFHGFTGGFGVVMGKTGGYIIGYVLAALITGFFADKVKKLPAVFLPIGMAIGLAVCYALGTAWFINLTHFGLSKSLTLCVFPFIAGDIVKIAAATFLTIRLRKVLRR